ncbi:pyridoxamine 5'-phosphate oxidase family protein [Catelliglobosispora koreensis]|uniref:pyridoxamine 5'-phosphate oxidase family protein n=1 Tax=Catelliglobosispora koreensis TaxID=129052 RepID=UPI0003762695|nr:pyridoxamine 5'-phosphate oxidase family protein [Catelliglobosispora koreensis]
MSDRAKAAMTDQEIQDFLGANTKMQLATINRDGTPHLVTMFYSYVDGQVAFWTYRSSQKALNLARDPRLTVLVEDGKDYFELRGVQINGVVDLIDDPAGVLGVGKLIAKDLTGVPEEGLDEFIAWTARKRLAYFVRPTRVSSWDHRKL